MRVRDEIAARRSTWQVWHVRGEAHRQVRAANLPAEHVDAVVDLVTDHTLTLASVRLTPSGDGIEEPPELRRVDGSSVYEIAGSAVYTSQDILAAEQRLVHTAGLADGHRASPDAVDLALLEQAANGTTLNPGQTALVTGMATSGNRLQLAIAPAGTGKTTAMRALAAAWVEDGGTVLGLAPSAAAAAVLREQTGATTDTLAKLTWSLQHDDLPDWARAIGPRTLVVIDEAGMADTLTLDTAVQFVTARGGQVRLIGDTQQLAAIGAGGVLRDIAATHGALHLDELMRFTDPVEGAASLALREGRTEALGFYLDHDRVHVGDLATITTHVFTAWATDRQQGLDAMMLAPTRDLVSQLNLQAQTHRLAGRNPGPGAPLADGNTAFVGDTIVTRANDRRLRLGANDWVKNGDRWTVQNVHHDGSLTVHHQRGGRVGDPARRLRARVNRARVRDHHPRRPRHLRGHRPRPGHRRGDPPAALHDAHPRLRRQPPLPASHRRRRPPRDPAAGQRPPAEPRPTSSRPSWPATTRPSRPPPPPATTPPPPCGSAPRPPATSTPSTSPPNTTSAPPPSPTSRPAPTGSCRASPTTPPGRPYAPTSSCSPPTAPTRWRPCTLAASARELDTADDRAAVLAVAPARPQHRHRTTALAPRHPPDLHNDPHWGPYLTARCALVTTLADEVRHQATDMPNTPPWWPPGRSLPTPDLLGDLAVWRAANAVPDSDHRPTGPTQPAKAQNRWQHELDTRLRSRNTATLADWTTLIHTLVPATRRDDYTPHLAEHLAELSAAGVDAQALLHTATAPGVPLPDDHAASALWWRIQRHLPDPTDPDAPNPPGWSTPQEPPTVREPSRRPRGHPRPTPPRRSTNVATARSFATNPECRVGHDDARHPRLVVVRQDPSRNRSIVTCPRTPFCGL